MRLAKAAGAVIATFMLVTATTPSAAQADLIPDFPRDIQWEEEMYRQRQQDKRQAQSDNVPDKTDSNTAWSIPTGIPVGWTEPILAVTGVLLAGGMTVWVLRRNGERDGRQGN